MTENERLEQLKSIVSNFSANIAEYKSGQYDESKTRTDFINKLFNLLDWDVENNQGFSEIYRDVVPEDKVKIEGTLKAPDYSFRIGGIRKFFVEAKKPSVNIKEAAEPAFQVRRYAYTAKLPLSILTNFEEFAIYDTRIKPDKNDKASVARIDYFTFKEYEQKFDFLYNTFSKNAINKGSFDKYVTDNKNKKGTSEVDTELLALVEDWRMALAKNIAINNPTLSIYNLNTTVQRIIDRIVFLRIAEDRGIEDENILLTVSKTTNIYEKLNLLFTKANVKYNSGLFAYEEWLEKIIIEDKILSNIIVNLYYPECPYEFSVLPIEILGSIYERFLGSTIHYRKIKGDTHTAVVEQKPEVKKAGGVYYTPQYIVDYIVQNTVGEKIKNKKPEEIVAIKICDPACGSGSFLVGAYQYLLNYHLDYYTQEKNVKTSQKNKKIFEAGHNTYRLTIDEKQRILTNNIFGVDIDNQAVEVTKLSLYLKLLEGESRESSEQLFKYSDMALLPSLEDNIKCGNSLIGTDFYAQLELTDDDRIKINCFDWDKDGFPEIFKNGGFDVVIGNPPYVFTRDVDWSDDVKNYYWNKFYITKNDKNTRKNQSGKINLYILFLLKSTELLNKTGLFSFIIPNSLLRTTTYDTTRKFILERTTIERIVDLKEGVFDGVTASTIILNLINNTISRDTLIIDANYKNDGFIDETKQTKVNQHNFLNNVSYAFSIFVNPEEQELINKLNKSNFFLRDIIIDIIEGIVAHKELISQTAINKKYKPMLEGKDIKKYIINFGNNYILFDKEKIHRTRPNYVWEAETKIVIQRISGGKSPLVAAIDKEKYLSFASTNILLINENMLSSYSYNLICALLNSKLWNFYYSKSFSNSSNLTVNISKTYLEMLPLPRQIDISKHDAIVSLVDKIIGLKQKEAKEPNQQSRTMISRQIVGIEQAIDTAVYQLYNLTNDEIKVVEGKNE
ncbi:Eco57I restriction-modification methylase domain-containing protein [Treponema sp. R80B11-R83G3]